MRMQVTVNEVIDADISIDEVLNQLPGDDYDREWIVGVAPAEDATRFRPAGASLVSAMRRPFGLRQEGY